MSVCPEPLCVLDMHQEAVLHRTEDGIGWSTCNCRNRHLPWSKDCPHVAAGAASIQPPCCPGHGSMAHVRACVNHPEAGR